jgi:hypothetical protein
VARWVRLGQSPVPCARPAKRTWSTRLPVTHSYAPADPGTAAQLLMAFATLGHTPSRSCAQALVAAAGGAFRRSPGSQQHGGPTKRAGHGDQGSAAAARGPGPDPSTRSEAWLRGLLRVGSRARRYALPPQQSAPSPLQPRLPPTPARLRPPQAVCRLEGAYPGEAWLAGWCAAYLLCLAPEEHSHRQGRPPAPPPAAAAEVLCLLSSLQVGPGGLRDKQAAHALEEMCRPRGSAAGPRAREPTQAFCPNTRRAYVPAPHAPPLSLPLAQCLPSEAFEEAALAALQPGLEAWAGLAARLGGPLAAAEGKPEHAGAGVPGCSAGPSPLGATAQSGPTAPGAPPLPLLALCQAAWAVGATAAACPLPHGQEAPREGSPTGAAAARRAARARLRELRSRVLSWALLALVAWGRAMGTGAAVAAADDAAASLDRGPGAEREGAEAVAWAACAHDVLWAWAAAGAPAAGAAAVGAAAAAELGALRTGTRVVAVQSVVS